MAPISPILKWALIGSGSGLAIGLLIGVNQHVKSKKLQDRRAQSDAQAVQARGTPAASAPTGRQMRQQLEEEICRGYKFLPAARDLVEALKRFTEYAKVEPAVYKSILDTCDRLAALQLLVSSKRYQTIYINKSYQHRDLVCMCLDRIRSRLTETQAKYFDEDSADLRTAVTNIAYNINQEVSSKMGYPQAGAPKSG